MATYIALLHKDHDSDYGVSFPDLPGCITAGRLLEDARLMAAEALALHIEGMIQDGEPVPAPSSLDAIMADPNHREAVVLLVDTPIRPATAVKVDITLPEDLLEAIDRASDDRSRFLADAARDRLKAQA